MDRAGDQQFEGAASAHTLASTVRQKMQKLEATCLERCKHREQHVQRVICTSLGAVDEIEHRVETSRVSLLDEHSEQVTLYVQSITDLYERILRPLRFFHEALPASVVTDLPFRWQIQGDSGNKAQSTGNDMTDVKMASDQTGLISPTTNVDSLEMRQGVEIRNNAALSSEGQRRESRQSRRATDQDDSLESYKRHFATTSLDIVEVSELELQQTHQQTMNCTTDSGLDVSSDTTSVREVPADKGISRVMQTVVRYREEVSVLADVIGEAFSKLRKDLRTVYRWGQGSVLDLYELLDDKLTDELYCAVRGKMARCLVTAARLDDIAKRIENDMGFASFLDLYIGSSSRGSTPATSPRKDDYDVAASSPFSELMALTEDSGSAKDSRRRAGNSCSRCSSRSSNASSATAPEPPPSPRPRKLGTHPKIIKDRHQWFEAQRRGGGSLYGGGNQLSNSMIW